MSDTFPTEECRFGPVSITFDPRVLRPRPWTLLQSLWAAELAASLPDGRLAEVCAGAGQIGLAAAVLAGRSLLQLDADASAVGFARVNADAAGMGGAVEVRQFRLGEPFAPAETFPLILADPPYLPSAETGCWPDDPLPAIDGGTDGLDVTRACLAFAGEWIHPDGAVLLQTAGAEQNAAVLDLLRGGPLECCDARSHDAHRSVLLLRPVGAPRAPDFPGHGR